MVTGNDTEVVALLEELVRWARFQGVRQAKMVLQDLLKEDTQKSLYHISDGRSSEEIARILGVSSQTVRNYWRVWFASGIVMPSKKYKGRLEKVFNLEDLGFPVPKVDIASAKSKGAGLSTNQEAQEDDK